jgi:hypothetical protein
LYIDTKNARRSRPCGISYCFRYQLMQRHARSVPLRQLFEGWERLGSVRWRSMSNGSSPTASIQY